MAYIILSIIIMMMYIEPRIYHQFSSPITIDKKRLAKTLVSLHLYEMNMNVAIEDMIEQIIYFVNSGLALQ